MTLLDMSKAFDTVDRKTLFENLEKILLPEELHLFSIITRNPNIKVNVNNAFSEYFSSLVGIMQGDCMSAILFIYYLGCCLQKAKQLIAAPDLLVTPKFADDITYIAREKETIEKVEKIVPTLLKEYNLQINTGKTERYEIPKPPPPTPTMETLQKHRLDKPLWSELDWLVNYKTTPEEDKTPSHKKCKLLGSILESSNNKRHEKAKLHIQFHANKHSNENTNISNIHCTNLSIQ